MTKCETIMKMMKKQLILICMSLLAVPLASAAGFGVAGEDSSAVVNQLVTANSTPASSSTSSNASSSNGTNSTNAVQTPVLKVPAAMTAAAAQLRSSNSSNNGNSNPNDPSTYDPSTLNNQLGDSPVGQTAFVNTVRNMMPLTPDQIRSLRYLFDKSQQAAAEAPGVPPKPTSSSVMVNLSPGSTPPIIRLGAGFVTSLVFLDSTGQPWPIVAYDLGDPQSFNVEPNVPDGKSDTLLVQALVSYKSGNLAVMLKGLTTPVMITLMPGQRAVDYRVDLRIPGMGPNAQPMIDGMPNTGDPDLLNFLDGIPPSGSQSLQVVGDHGQTQAWLSNGNIYLRTRLQVLSPSWLSTISSPDGTHVYEMSRTPVILASDRGSMVQLTIKGL